MPTAKIASKQALHTLKQLHAELAGKLIENGKEASRLRQSMKQVEAVMKLLEPSYNLRKIAVRRRRLNPWFKRGTVFRHALDVLRTADEPLTARQIAGRMIAAKGVTDVRAKAVRDLAGSVNASLQNHDGNSVMRNGDGMPAEWKCK
jgi:hypothetical protein